MILAKTRNFFKKEGLFVEQYAQFIVTLALVTIGAAIASFNKKNGIFKNPAWFVAIGTAVMLLSLLVMYKLSMIKLENATIFPTFFAFTVGIVMLLNGTWLMRIKE